MSGELGMGDKGLELRLEGLVWGYPKRRLGGPLELTLAPGQALALVGPNGVGKSTLLRTIAGLQPPLAGAATVGEMPLGSGRQRARHVAMLEQGAIVDPSLTVRELVELGRTAHLGLFGRLQSADQQAVALALTSCDLEQLAERPLGQLSGGELQRARLALALAQQAPLMLLDEPTTHLDLRRRQQLFELLSQLRRERELTQILVLHELAEAYREADRVVVLDDQGSARELPADAGDRHEVLAAAFGVDPSRIVLG
jgi:iron complex transport system ATP-binding protein